MNRALAGVLLAGVIFADIYVFLFPLSIYGLQSDIPLLLMVMLGIGCVSYQFIEIDQIRENKTCAAVICTIMYIIKALLFAGYIICVLNSTSYSSSVYQSDALIIDHVDPVYVNNISRIASEDGWFAPVVFHFADGRAEYSKSAQIWGSSESYCFFPIVPDSYAPNPQVRDYRVNSFIVCSKSEARSTCLDLVLLSSKSCFAAVRSQTLSNTIGVKITSWRQQTHEPSALISIQQQISPDFIMDKTSPNSPYLFTLFKEGDFYSQLNSNLVRLVFFLISFHLCYLLMYFFHIYCQKWLQEHFRSTVIFPDLEMQVVSSSSRSNRSGATGENGESSTEADSSVNSTREPSLDLERGGYGNENVEKIEVIEMKRLEDVPAEIVLVSKTQIVN
eukprot:TRINITY_DN8149_c0_g1_i1.p1 TRINITY_DN8149_c0_g1~~TRINITY_DN8149_c0_g1_i1.p1  ORF type:complete len:390 (-),score=55.32 TRINITY_DN8149_c0_g1_i1:319-1488(-)